MWHKNVNILPPNSNRISETVDANSNVIFIDDRSRCNALLMLNRQLAWIVKDQSEDGEIRQIILTNLTILDESNLMCTLCIISELYNVKCLCCIWIINMPDNFMFLSRFTVVYLFWSNFKVLTWIIRNKSNFKVIFPQIKEYLPSWYFY